MEELGGTRVRRGCRVVPVPSAAIAARLRAPPRLASAYRIRLYGIKSEDDICELSGGIRHEEALDRGAEVQDGHLRPSLVPKGRRPLGHLAKIPAASDDPNQQRQGQER